MKEYKPSLLFKNAHINTIFPTFFRKIEVKYQREKIFLNNFDFLNFDWIKNGNKRIIILCHGLEGSSNSHYIKAFAKYFSERNWDVLALNYRSCDGEISASPFYYVSGKGDEIEIALKYTAAYDEIVLIGFSLGANKILHYLGNEDIQNKKIKGAFVVSPPCDLHGSSLMMIKKSNKFYSDFFLKQLKNKVLKKEEKYPKIFNSFGISLEKVLNTKNLIDFDNEFTAKLNGFKNADEYYIKNSSLYTLNKIKINTLILTAMDDPMMSESCYPREKVKLNPFLNLQTPKYGGHVSYASFTKEYWLENYAYDYIENNIIKKDKA
ncbi:YheT family hydrolase [Fusobacterium russii]|uniref:YheT family hydrolase n=1 Tax=Fusobacterium russii TaxID=854 RepID=UPI0003A7F51E|nr:alpha/beta fold hydrolase [Fusobacterium russii]